MNLKRDEMKIDEIIPKKDDLEQIISYKLSLLKQRMLRSKQARPRKIFSIFTFVAGGLLILFSFIILGRLDSSIRFSKQILGTATSGFEFMQEGSFKEAAQNFETIQKQIADSNELVIKILNILPAGFDPNRIVQASTQIIGALNFAILGVREFEEMNPVWDPLSNSSDQQFYFYTQLSREYFLQALENIKIGIDNVQVVNTSFLPAEIQTKFLEARDGLILAKKLLEDAVSLQTFVLNILGGEKKTYLLIFQNNNEARAGGGFIGTYGILEFENGRFRIIKIESIYDLDGQLKEIIPAPGPLQRQVSATWGMRDSNWFVDFPESSRKILYFLEKESGILADGVISMTPNVLEQLLPLTGKIEMPEYDVVLTSANFRSTIQYKTSEDYNRILNQPKKILADFTPRFLIKLLALKGNERIEALRIISEMIAQKQILMFSLDQELEKEIIKFGLGGEIKQTDGDYLAIFHSNVGGGKTDQSILQKVEKKVSIDSGGLAIVKLKITRTHSGFDEKYFPKNLDYLRILVPARAELLAARGFDDYPLLPSTYQGASTDPDLAFWDQQIKRDEKTRMYIGRESDYRVFSNWLELAPGETKTVELTYEIQFDSGSHYTHLLQKQPGSRDFEFSLELNYLPGNITYFYPQNLVREGNRLSITENVRADRFYGVIGQ